MRPVILQGWCRANWHWLFGLHCSRKEINTCFTYLAAFCSFDPVVLRRGWNTFGNHPPPHPTKFCFPIILTPYVACMGTFHIRTCTNKTAVHTFSMGGRVKTGRIKFRLQNTIAMHVQEYSYDWRALKSGHGWSKCKSPLLLGNCCAIHVLEMLASWSIWSNKHFIV